MGAAGPASPPTLRHTHPGWHLLSEGHADLCDEALQIVRSTALGLGLPLRSLEIEMGPSQFEAVFAPTDALTAADQMLALRNGVRQALRRAGYQASFVCKPPLAGSVASGWHLHQSLVDGEGRNAFVTAKPARKATRVTRSSLCQTPACTGWPACWRTRAAWRPVRAQHPGLCALPGRRDGTAGGGVGARQPRCDAACGGRRPATPPRASKTALASPWPTPT